jgi:hypothetical protein
VTWQFQTFYQDLNTPPPNREENRKSFIVNKLGTWTVDLLISWQICPMTNNQIFV